MRIAPDIDLIPTPQALTYSGTFTKRSAKIHSDATKTALKPPVTNDTPTVVFSNAPKIEKGLLSAAKASLPVYIMAETVTIIKVKIGNTRLRTWPFTSEDCVSVISSALNANFSCFAIAPISKEK